MLTILIEKGFCVQIYCASNVVVCIAVPENLWHIPSHVHREEQHVCTGKYKKCSKIYCIRDIMVFLIPVVRKLRFTVWILCIGSCDIFLFSWQKGTWSGFWVFCYKRMSSVSSNRPATYLVFPLDEENNWKLNQCCYDKK